MITQKYIDNKGCYVICKDGIYMSLTPAQVIEMNKLTADLVVDAVHRICEKAVEEAEAPLKEALKAAKKSESKT